MSSWKEVNTPHKQYARHASSMPEERTFFDVLAFVMRGKEQKYKAVKVGYAQEQIGRDGEPEMTVTLEAEPKPNWDWRLIIRKRRSHQTEGRALHQGSEMNVQGESDEEIPF